jgi:hypothetical protein
MSNDKKDYGYSSAPIKTEVYDKVKEISDKTGKKLNWLITDLVLKGLEVYRHEGKNDSKSN